MKPILWTRHARENSKEPPIPEHAVELAVREPEWREADPSRPAVERRYRAFPELEGRVVKVACVETEAHIRIITFHLDRNARRRRREWTSPTTPTPTS